SLILIQAVDVIRDRNVTGVQSVLFRSDTMHAMTLLIHDRVPGGTGYLAAFKEPQTVFEVLKAAWEIVSQCPCQQEERRACHRCLDRKSVAEGKARDVGCKSGRA